MTDEPNQVAVREDTPPAAVATPGALLAAFIELARDPNVRNDVLVTIGGMQERAEAQQREAMFNADFSRLMDALPRVRKNGTLEYSGKKIARFAKWDDIDAAIRPILRDHGFTLNFNSRVAESGAVIYTAILRHRGGHRELTDTPPLPADNSGGKNAIQAQGSASSYGERYAAKLALNLVFEGEDDDGKRGGMRFIGPDDIKVIRAMMVEGGVTDEGRFLEAMQHTHIENIEAGELNLVKNILAKRISDRKQKAAS